MDGQITGRREYLLSEAPRYLRDAYAAMRPFPSLDALSTAGFTLNCVGYRIYRDAAARENAKKNGIDEWDAYKIANPSIPVAPNGPPAEERPTEFYANEIVQEFARRWNTEGVSWWPLLLPEGQAVVLEHLIEQRETYALRPTARQLVDAALALDGKATNEQFDLMLEALRSKS